MSGVLWLGGAAEVCSALEAALGGSGPGACRLVRTRSRRRRHLRARLASGEALFLKQFVRGRGSRLRRALEQALRLGPAQREWRHLVRLHRAGAPVPRPRALGRLANGDFVLAMDDLEGRPLAAALRGAPGERWRLLEAVAAAVARLHAAGFVHRDLHAGNLLVTGGGPVLLDLQAAWPSRSRWARHRDWADLDNALASLSTPDRVRLRAAALGLERPFAPEAKRRLRALGRASMARGRAHATSRTRRALRPGRRYARVRAGAWSGIRLRRVDEAEIRAALGEAAEPRPAASAGAAARDPSPVVETYAAGSALQRAADLWRGSPARRAWLAGQGLHARRIASVAPLAFLERRRLGLVTRSLLVVERPGPLRSADLCDESPAAVLDALLHLALALHRRGVVHRALDARHVSLERSDGHLRSRLLRLEGVRFARRPGDGPRLRALARLNASLPERFPDALRRRAFERYAAALPFRRPRQAALRRIVALSLARRDRWSGRDCRLAGGAPGARDRTAREPRTTPAP